MSKRQKLQDKETLGPTNRKIHDLCERSLK